jgi:cephalosporin hydroxylase
LLDYLFSIGKIKKNNLNMNIENEDLPSLTQKWFVESCKQKYSYNFTWMGRPIIQYPQDIVAMQEIIWQVQPDLIIDTGIAHGGSLVFYASLLELIGNNGQVLGIDIDIRSHNRVEIEKHPMFKRISMIEGSSIDKKIAEEVYDFAKGKQRILVTLDSNHTHDHVLKELELYSPLVTKGSYLVVFDTVVEDLPNDFFPDRPWNPGNNPKTAVWEFLKTSDRFEIDKSIETKLLITVAPDGYLKCIKD